MLDIDTIAALAIAGQAGIGVVLVAYTRRAHRRARKLRWFLRQSEGHVGNLQRALGDAYRDLDQFRGMAEELGLELTALRQRERAVEVARASRKRAKRSAQKDADRHARRLRTIKALDEVGLRPRDEVVAETRARRKA